jgi:Ser-tRNA(Ala) deacylase AlaX
VLLADLDRGIVLDRSAFYPGGGGQPPDHGVLLWGNVRTRIVGARKGDDLYLLPTEGDPLPPAGTSVHGGLDDQRRTSLMRTHSALHVLSAIVLRDFGAPVTGGDMEPLTARMDFDLPDVPADFKQHVEDACNEAIQLNRQIEVRVLPRAQALAIPNIIRTRPVRASRVRCRPGVCADGQVVGAPPQKRKGGGSAGPRAVRADPEPRHALSRSCRRPHRLVVQSGLQPTKCDGQRLDLFLA